jgi:pantoate ligase/cytidylate kinase
LVLQRMVKDLDLPIELIIGSTVRESDGLAKSSRNRYLDSDERKKATIIYRALQAAEKSFEMGERDSQVIENAAREVLQEVSDFRIQYCELRSFPDLEKISRIENNGALAIAGFMGKTRLIDNVLLG